MIDEIDRIALEAAMVKAAEEDPSRGEQLAGKLASGEPWEEVAAFAASCCQSRALRLKPWQEPPCVCDEDDANDRSPEGRKLLRQMLRAGVSRYAPDPMAALKAAKAKQ